MSDGAVVAAAASGSIPPASMIHCATCDTDFSSEDAAQAWAHSDHQLEHIEPGGDPAA